MLRSDFTYNGHRLSDFNFKMFDVDSDPEWISRVIDRSTQTAARDIPVHFTTHHDDVLKHDFLIIRDPSLYQLTESLRLTDKDIDQLRAWLEYPKVPMELITTVDDEEIDVRYFGLFTSIQPFVVHKQCFGLRLQFTCNAPYGFSSLISRRFTVSAQSGNDPTVQTNSFLDCQSEFAELVPATIRIYPKTANMSFPSGAKLDIYNSATNQTMKLTLPQNYSQIEISCEHKAIVGTATENSTVIQRPLTLEAVGMTSAGGFFGDLTQVFSATFLDFVPGSNILTLTNKSSIDVCVEIETRYIVKGGGF